MLYLVLAQLEDIDLWTGASRGVAVDNESVGNATFEQDLACLRTSGELVPCGQASSQVSTFELGKFAGKSLFLTRPMLFNYTRFRETLLTRARTVMDWVATGTLRLRIWRTDHLCEASQAHHDLEARAALGKVLLLPD